MFTVDYDSSTLSVTATRSRVQQGELTGYSGKSGTEEDFLVCSAKI